MFYFQAFTIDSFSHKYMRSHIALDIKYRVIFNNRLLRAKYK